MLPPLVVPHKVLKPLASEIVCRQLAGSRPVHGGEIVEALPE